MPKGKGYHGKGKKAPKPPGTRGGRRKARAARKESRRRGIKHG